MLSRIKNKTTKNFIKNLIHEEEGAMYEFLGLILFLLIILGLLVPLAIELFIYNNQAQELDRLTKVAAKRACNLMPIPSDGIGSDINQSSLGVGTDVRIMQPLVNAVFWNEAAHPDSYFENTQDGENIDLKILDFLGQEISQTDFVSITDRDGKTDDVLMVGSNTDAGLCPAGGGANWKYCLQDDEAAKQALMQNGQPENEDLVARMEMFQPGRCAPGQDCSNDFTGRIDRCTVCATKSRQSIFSRSVFLRTILFLDCSQFNNLTILPCKMTACATSRYVQFSGKRGYAPHYRDQMNLGQTYRALEGNPNARSEELSDGTADPSLFCLMIEGQGARGMFENLIGSEACEGSLSGNAGGFAPTTSGLPPVGFSPQLPSTPSIPSVPSIPGTGDITGAIDGVTGTIDGVTGTIDGITGTIDGVTGTTSGTTVGATGSTTEPEPIDPLAAERTALQQAYDNHVLEEINLPHQEHSIEITEFHIAAGTIGEPVHLAEVQQAIDHQRALLETATDLYNTMLSTLEAAGNIQNNSQLSDLYNSFASDYTNHTNQLIQQYNLSTSLINQIHETTGTTGSAEHIAQLSAAQSLTNDLLASSQSQYNSSIDSFEQLYLTQPLNNGNGNNNTSSGSTLGSTTGNDVGATVGGTIDTASSDPFNQPI